MYLENPTIGKVHEGLLHKNFSARELTEEYLERIKKQNPALNAFLSITEKEALDSAKETDYQIAQGLPVNPLTGVPAAVKDVIITKGIRTTAGSKMLETYTPPYDATVIEKLKGEGYVLLGKTNCDEFAMGSSNENSAYGPVKNPWDLTRVPGGTSGGSAAAVAAGLVPYALGTDTGGSVRQPAAMCGIVGIKPTYGRISRYGVIATASSLDQVGVLARTVEDAEIVFHTLKGFDPKDATSVSAPNSHPEPDSESKNNLKGVKIGIPVEYVGTHWDKEGMEDGVKAKVKQAVSNMEKLGAEIISVSLPHAPYALAAYYIINPSEISSNLARYDGIRFGGVDNMEEARLIERYMRVRAQGFGAESKRRVMVGTHALSSGYYDAYYRKAQQMRTYLRRDFEQVFQQVDLIACPTSPTVAFRLGAKSDDPLAMYLGDIFTITVNLVSLPGLSLPCGFASAPDDNTGSPPKKGETPRGGVALPVGLQLIGKHFDEPLLFRVGKAYQHATDHHLKTPPL